MDELGRGQGMVHPDVEERMKQLGKNSEGMSLRRYKNSILIKCDNSSLIVAVAFGTAYSIKTGSMFEQAIDSGAKISHQWSDGSSLDLAGSFGHDWIVGAWKKDEKTWIHSASA